MELSYVQAMNDALNCTELTQEEISCLLPLCVNTVAQLGLLRGADPELMQGVANALLRCEVWRTAHTDGALEANATNAVLMAVIKLGRKMPPLEKDQPLPAQD